jgi:hypothetical protein
MARRSRSAATSGPLWRTAPGRTGDSPPPVVKPEVAKPEPVAPQARIDSERPPQQKKPARSGRAIGAGRGGWGVLARNKQDEGLLTRSIRSLDPISDLEAAAFAGRFAADFQSFDEDDPGTRAEVLRLLLADPRASTWGWSGEGRQRADSPLPGRIFRTSDTVVFVEVFVRVTTYARAQPQPVRGAPALADVEPVGRVGPSSAPPEYDPRWCAIEANWVRMTVPVTRSPDDGRLVVDPHLVPGQTA